MKILENHRLILLKSVKNDSKEERLKNYVRANIYSGELSYAVQTQFKKHHKLDIVNVIKDVICQSECVAEYKNAQRKISLPIKLYSRNNEGKINKTSI